MCSHTNTHAHAHRGVVHGLQMLLSNKELVDLGHIHELGAVLFEYHLPWSYGNCAALMSDVLAVHHEY